MNGVGARRPSRVAGIGHDLHPGIVSMPGSVSVLAAVDPPRPNGSHARETNPNSLPGTLPNCFAGSDLLNARFSVVSFRPTSRCFERGLLIQHGTGFASRIGQFRISLRSELGGESAQDCAQPLGSIAPLGCGVRHAQHVGGGRAREVGEAFRESGENVRERG